MRVIIWLCMSSRTPRYLFNVIESPSMLEEEQMFRFEFLHVIALFAWSSAIKNEPQLQDALL